ncbi:MAG: peptidoglycan-binding protein [bacterium]|nr:peptidoglycan-binding protein [bacterium]
MENFKFMILSIIIIVVLFLAGFWAVTTLEPGSFYVDKQRQEQLKQENEELAKEVEKLKSELRLLEKDAQEPVTPLPTTTTPEPEKPLSTKQSKNQILINELQKLIDDKVSMKEKSKGTRVGTVQTFLNLYNGTKKRIDNDYGKTTKIDVINFQKKESLPADGEAGPSSFKKMIDWLEKQG